MTVPADSLRAVLDSVFAGRDYRWVERKDPFATAERWFQALRQWLTELHDAHPASFRILMVGLIIVVLAIIAHAGWIFIKTVRASAPGHEALPTARGEPRNRAWYRAEADRLAAERRYAEAIQADFLALMLAFDASRLVRFHPSKTPAEYSLEVKLAGSAREEFVSLVRTLYGYAFARRPCGPDDFAEWRARAAPERYASA